MILKILLLALAGAIGTLARYELSGFIHKIDGISFPWGTVAVNLAGCFLAGFLWTLFEGRWPVSGEARALMLVGFMGAFTTFSTFMLETDQLLRSGEWLYATANIAIHNGLGLAMMLVGVAVARWV